MPMMVPLARSFIASILLCAFFLLCAQASASGLLTPREQNRGLAEIDGRPVVFFVAKGAADSCGRGCSEWIAAVGTFDVGAGQRFREFIEKLNDRDLPIFFHSRGGRIKAGGEIGYILRARHMTSGIGKTETRKCRVFDRKDAACQKVISAGQSIDARLMMNEGQCHSACVTAFVGGSNRLVASGAKIGVHSPHIEQESSPGQSRLRKARTAIVPDAAEQALVDRVSRQYFIGMGVDPGLHDLSLKTDPQHIYVLSRDEIARLGLETRKDTYETPWAKLYVAEKFVLTKSVTLRTSLEPVRYSTTQFAFHCGNAGRHPFFGFHRQIVSEREQVTKIVLTMEDVFLPFYVKPSENNLEIGVTGEIWQDTLAKMVQAKFLTVSETSSKTGETLNEIRLSGSGLEQGLSEFQRRCITPAMTTVFPMTPLIPSDLATKKKSICRSASQC